MLESSSSDESRQRLLIGDLHPDALLHSQALLLKFATRNEQQTTGTHERLGWTEAVAASASPGSQRDWRTWWSSPFGSSTRLRCQGSQPRAVLETHAEAAVARRERGAP